MAGNKGKINQIHDLLPSHLNTKTNTNWKALIDALGEQDQKTADLVTEVRKQFFVKTASRPYLDRLAQNNKISRPRLVGMDDPSFRDYIPVLSYQPKQVKLIIDQLLDIFFFKESTTAFITSSAFQPFKLNDGWELELSVDEQYDDRVIFNTSDFTDINNATANEIVAAINRQTKYSYATAYYDSITKNTFIRMFTNTVGSKGSLRILGGRANIGLRFNGFLDNSGNGINTQWTVSKIGDTATFANTGGADPGIQNLQEGDIAIIDLPNNQGSFVITNVDLVANSFKFTNLFATPGVYTNMSADSVKFVRPQKFVAYLNNRRAMTWETSPGEITVEMPTSPPVVKRSLKGSIHVSGAYSQMLSRISDNSLTMVDAFEFPETGTFWLERLDAIVERIVTPTENQVVTKTMNTRLQYEMDRYEYASRTALDTTGDIALGANQITNLASVVGLAQGNQIIHPSFPPYTRITSIVGNVVNTSFPSSLPSVTVSPIRFLGNTLSGITPDLPLAAGLNEFALVSLVTTGNTVTGTTPTPHNYLIGDTVAIAGSSGIQVGATTGDLTIGSNVIMNVPNISGVAPGILISGASIPIGTTILSNTPTTITMSSVSSATVVAEAIAFSENLNQGGVINAVTSTTFSYFKLGTAGTASTPGTSRVERIGLANSGSKVILTDAIPNTVSRITGAYIWDLAAAFVLSSNTATIQDSIQAGKIVRLLNTTSNDMPAGGGYIIFDYGRNTQEGPVRYLYKPTDNTIALDPSYTFKHSHSIGSPIVAISRKGPHQMSGKATEYPAYITDPSDARFILEDLIRSVKSAGIFVNFLVRYPDQLYATLDVYQSGIDPG
jgi:hypothetical protein